MRYPKVQEVSKGPRGTKRSKRYQKVQEVPKGPRGTYRSKKYLKVQEKSKGPGFSTNVTQQQQDKLGF